MHSKRVIGVLLLSLAAITVTPAYAFPGDQRDELCASLIAAAAQTGAPVPDDCLSTLGMSAIELRAAEASMLDQAAPPVTRVPYQETSFGSVRTASCSAPPPFTMAPTVTRCASGTKATTM